MDFCSTFMSSYRQFWEHSLLFFGIWITNNCELGAFCTRECLRALRLLWDLLSSRNICSRRHVSAVVWWVSVVRHIFLQIELNSWLSFVPGSSNSSDLSRTFNSSHILLSNLVLRFVCNLVHQIIYCCTRRLAELVHAHTLTFIILRVYLLN